MKIVLACELAGIFILTNGTAFESSFVTSEIKNTYGSM